MRITRNVELRSFSACGFFGGELPTDKRCESGGLGQGELGAESTSRSGKKGESLTD